MRKFLLYMALLSVCLPAFAADNEFKFGVRTNTRYNDNVDNVSSNKQDAIVFEIGPRFKLDTRAPLYEAGVNYAPSFKIYSQGDQVDEFSHRLNARGDYRPTDRLTLGLRESLAAERDSDRDFSDDPTIDLDGGGHKQTLRNRLSGDVRYGLTQRLSLSSNAGYRIVEREDKDLADVESISGSAQSNYVLSMRDSIAIGASVRRQTVEGSPGSGRRKTRTDSYGFFLFGSHRFTPTYGVSVSGGPTWLRSSRTNDGRSGDETNLEYFASAEVNADYDRGSASLAYTRASSDVAFSATTYLIDRVTGTVDWQLSPRLVFGATAEWNQREAVLKFEDQRFVNSVDQWLAAANLSYRMTPEVFGGFTVDYLRQDSGASGTVDRVRAVIRFDYNAQALRF
ncbi:MAG: hypothetical protein QF570_22490 [Myxococcota bacterium]|jgi:hypothetical protein|nr:hypothetical protein [Myxococcota bacterium]